MGAALVRNLPVAVGLTTWVLGIGLGFLLALLLHHRRAARREAAAYQRGRADGFNQGYQAHIRKTAEAMGAATRRPGWPRIDATRPMPAVAQPTTILPTQRRKP